MSTTASSGLANVLQGTCALCHEQIGSLVEAVQNSHEAHWKLGNREVN